MFVWEKMTKMENRFIRIISLPMSNSNYLKILVDSIFHSLLFCNVETLIDVQNIRRILWIEIIHCISIVMGGS